MDEEKWNEKCSKSTFSLYRTRAGKAFQKSPFSPTILLENLKNWGFRLSLLFSSCIGIRTSRKHDLSNRTCVKHMLFISDIPGIKKGMSSRSIYAVPSFYSLCSASFSIDQKHPAAPVTNDIEGRRLSPSLFFLPFMVSTISKFLLFHRHTIQSSYFLLFFYWKLSVYSITLVLSIPKLPRLCYLSPLGSGPLMKENEPG